MSNYLAGATKALRVGSRLLLAAPFVGGGLGYWQNRELRVQIVSNLGLPRPATAALVDAVAKVGGGAALVVTPFPRTAAAGLLANLVPTTVFMFPFWRIDNPAERAARRNDFIKNVALAGALLGIVAAPRRS